MSDAPLEVLVGEPAPVRADAAIARHFPGASRKRIAELFDAGHVRLGARRLRKGDRLAADARLTLAQPPARAEDLRVAPDPDAAARLTWLLERPDVVAVAKPAGMPSHPLRAGERGTAAGGIVARYPECAAIGADPREAGLVHRLDGDTTGVLVAARDAATWQALRAAFGAGAVTKRYLALTTGAPRRLRCDAALAQRGARVVVDEADGLPASTSFEVLAEAGGLAWVRCTAHTGRMHQVRAHLAHVGAPLLGDARYGGAASPEVPRFVLHAAEVELPLGGARVTITAPLPPDLAALRARLGLG